MKDSIGIILEAVPAAINTERLRDDLKCIDGVRWVVRTILAKRIRVIES